MTDPKAEALARLKWQERNSEANMALMSARDIFRDGVFDGYDARDEELAEAKAALEKMRARVWELEVALQTARHSALVDAMSYFASRIGFEWHGSKLGVVCWECGHFVGRGRGSWRRFESLYRAVEAMLITHYEKHHPTRLETP